MEATSLSIDQILQSIFSVLSPLFAAVITTVIAIVLARYLWNWYNRPKLEFCETSTVYASDDVVDGDNWDLPVTLFRIHVANQGNSAARNCKPELILRGESDTHRYELSTSVIWSEGDNPSRQTINRSENTSFGICLQGPDGTDEYIRFPSENGWIEYSTLNEEPLPSYQEQASGATVSATRNRTSTETLSEVDWHQATVKITAENAGAIEGTVEFQWENGKLDCLAVSEKE